MTSPYREQGQTDPIEPDKPSLPMPGRTKWTDDRYMSLFLASLTGASTHAIDFGEESIVDSAERVADVAWRRMYDAGVVRELY